MRHKRRKATPKNGFIARIKAGNSITKIKAHHLANSLYIAKLLALYTNTPSNSEPLIREAVICQI